MTLYSLISTPSSLATSSGRLSPRVSTGARIARPRRHGNSPSAWSATCRAAPRTAWKARRPYSSMASGITAGAMRAACERRSRVTPERRVSLHALRREPSRVFKQSRGERAEDHAADMCHVCHAACLHCRGHGTEAHQLYDKPYTNQERGRDEGDPHKYEDDKN